MDGAKAFGSEVIAGSVRIGMCQQRCRVVQYTLAGCGRVLVGAGVPSSQPALATVVDAVWLGGGVGSPVSCCACGCADGGGGRALAGAGLCAFSEGSWSLREVECPLCA